MRGNIELVRRLGSSRFNYWFGYVANGAWVAFLCAHGMPGGESPVGLRRGAALVAGGLLAWTLLEYLLHRYLYHVLPTFLRTGHLLHHERSRELIGIPWYITSAALWGLWMGLRNVVDPGALGVAAGSCWAGYIGYCLVHHGTHHWRMASGYGRRLKKLHQLHHIYPDTNWGVTTPLWDHVFGTYVGPETVRVRRQTAGPNRPRATATPRPARMQRNA